MISVYAPIADALLFGLWTLIENWHLAFAATIFGMAMGVNPGMGGSVGIAILIPIFVVGGISPATAFLLYGCVLGATTFAGSISAILANVPGGGSNAATLLDGYPLSRQGEANRAISASAFSSAGGAVLGLIMFILLIPIVLELVTLFGPAEMLWVIVIGLAIIPIVSGDRIIMGFAVGVLGMFLGLYGESLMTGEFRYHYGIPQLADGFALVPLIIGLFAFAEVMRLAMEGESTIAGDDTIMFEGGRLAGLKDVIEHKSVFFRGSVIGVLIGAIPGAGGSVATFVSYAQAVATSKNPASFGKGNIAGVIASESANDSKDGGQLFPTMGLGIPGSASTAVLLGAFLAHGVIPGPALLTEHLNLMMCVIVGLLISNLASSIIGLITVNYLTMITKMDVQYLYPSIILIGLFSTFYLRNSPFDMVMAVAFGILGYILLIYNISRVPLIIAFVLGPIMEDNFWIAFQLGGHNFYNAFFTGWLNILLIIIFILTLVYGIRSLIEQQEDVDDNDQ